jgi:DNA end-binding protein Ku
MGAIQNIKVQMGLVFFDAAIKKATNERNSISFKRLHKSKKVKQQNDKGEEVEVEVPCAHETGQKIYCKGCAIDIANDDTVKGYEFSKGQYITIDEDKLDELKVESSGAVICRDVVTREEFQKIGHMLTGVMYRLEPPEKDKYPPTTFALIHAAQEDKVAIGKISIYGRTQVCAVVPDKNSFLMHMLRFPNEVRQAPDKALPPIDQKQLSMAKQIIASMLQPTIDLNYRDEYGEQVKQYVDSLVPGAVALQATKEEAPKLVPDSLDDMLKRTLELFQTQGAGKPVSDAPVAEEPKPEKKPKGRKAKVA